MLENIHRCLFGDMKNRVTLQQDFCDYKIHHEGCLLGHFGLVTYTGKYHFFPTVDEYGLPEEILQEILDGLRVLNEEK